VALQPHYNLVERAYEQTLAPAAAEWDLAVLPYYALAAGFLTGKYRPGGETVDSVRAQGASKYLNESGEAALKALDHVAAAHQTTMAAVAIAWLLTRPTVTTPIASARTTEQLAQILPAAELELTPDEIDLLTSATTQG
jgi:aryl-alcohol dehydrogenase-like predicted oxidoreductase